MKRLVPLLALGTLLSGCASTWVVDSDVKTFSSIDTVPPGATYRFERLPSQQAAPEAQQALEAMAEPALAQVGLRRDDASPQYSAQIGAHVQTTPSPWADPWIVGSPWPYYGGFGYGPWGPYGYGRRAYGYGWYGSPAYFPQADNPWYEREVSIVLRELGSNRVVYETHARNDGPYNISARILPVMFQAALQGFPKPPQGERKVNIPLQPPGAQAAAK